MSPRSWIERWLGHREDRFGLLLAFLVVAFVTFGTTEARWANFVGALATFGALIVGLTSTGTLRFRPRLAVWAVVAVIGMVILIIRPASEVSAAVGSICQAIVLTVILVAVVARILEHRTVQLPTLLGAISAYMLLGMVFAWVFQALAELSTAEVLDPLEGEVPIYYSFTVLTTLGFGDIVPATELVRRVTTLEAVMGQVFLATLVARLMSLYGQERA